METTRVKRHSQARDAILELLQNVNCHPSADWIYNRLKEEHPNLGIATVYRQLADLRKSGAISSVVTVQGQERYDGNTKPHTHFICHSCGAVIDLHEIAEDPDLIEKAEQQYSVKITSHALLYHGTCNQCQN